MIVIAPRDAVFEKTVSNMQEVAARGGRIILIGERHAAEEAALELESFLAMPDMGAVLRADRLRRAGADARLSHRRDHGKGRRPAAQSGQIGDGGVGRRRARALHLPARAAMFAAPLPAESDDDV